MKEKLEYTYQFANGDTVTLTALGSHAKEDGHISRKWVELLNEMDREDFNNAQTEHRRHCSLESRDPADRYLGFQKQGFEDIEFLITWTAIQEELSEMEKAVAEKHFLQGFTIKETADYFGITTRWVELLLRRIRKKLKNFDF